MLEEKGEKDVENILKGIPLKSSMQQQRGEREMRACILKIRP